MFQVTRADVSMANIFFLGTKKNCMQADFIHTYILNIYCAY